MTGPELIALGHAAIARAHELILLGGALGLLSIIAGLISRRVGAPMLLVFLALGMLAGEDGVLGIPYDDFTSAYLIGSVALAVILFEGGLKNSGLDAASRVLARGGAGHDRRRVDRCYPRHLYVVS